MAAIPFIIFSAIDVIKKKGKVPVRILSIALTVFVVGVTISPKVNTATINQLTASNKVSNKYSDIKLTQKSEISTPVAKTSFSGQLRIHYIDVGQGDGILIQQGSKNMLIDTGTNASTTSLIRYLQSQNIKKIDDLVLTHPHEDHIGGADAVIKGFDIGALYMNKITTTTNTYKDVVSAISSKGLKPIEPAPEMTFMLGDATCTILSPIKTNEKDLNTYSIVIKLVFGDNKFLFTGDTQASNEQDMINKGYDLSADVLKVAHHGSGTSTTLQFLDKVNPKYAVISVGKDNDYGHPHSQTMDKLKAKNIQVYRTDENGTIVVSTKPGDYAFGKVEKGTSSTSTQTTIVAPVKNTPAPTSTSKPNPVPATIPTPTQNDERTVYYTPGGKSYHYNKNCSTLSRSNNILSGKLSEVIKLGKSDPCDKCAK
jgi:competence protein ComEC